MSFAQDTGYTPTTFAAMMSTVREGVNEQFGTTFTAESFVGTNWYKHYYVFVQQMLQNETKTSEIFIKLQEYIATTNDRIQRPSVSGPGLLDSFAANGYVASTKKNLEADAGTISICVDTDDAADEYAATRLAICTLIKDFVVAGLVSLGTETESITLSNGQSFDFKFFLPDYTPVKLRLTLNTSDNTLLTIPSDQDIRQVVFDAILARYRLGWNFEPQRYFTQADAPYAESVLLEWSDDDGANWYDDVFPAEFQDLFTFGLEDIDVLVDPP